MIQQSLDAYYEHVITDIGLSNDLTTIQVSRVNTDNNTVHQVTSPIPDFNETDSMSIHFIKNKPVDKTITDISTYSVQPNDRVIYDSFTDITYVHKDGEVYIIRDTPIDNAFIRVPNYKVGRLYKGMSVVKYTNGRMYMSTKPTATIPLAGNSNWIEVTEFDMFIARCEIDTESLDGMLVVEYLSDLIDGSNVEAHYTLSNSSLGDLLENHLSVEPFPSAKSIQFSLDNSRILVDDISAGLKLPDSLNEYALKSGSLRFSLSQLPVLDSSIISVSQGDDIEEYCFKVFIAQNTGELILGYRTSDGGAVTTVASGTILNINTEYSLVYSIDGTSVIVYIDGSTEAINHTMATDMTSIPLGIFVAVELDQTPSFDGSVRDVRLYDNPLTSQEAQEVYDYGN